MAAGLGYEILGAVKVKDGLFIGDELAAQDLEFVVSNKVTRIINCCGRQVPNHWESIGVAYLTYYWVDADNQVILDQRDVVSSEIFRFVEEALSAAESVLIHSVRGQSRSCCVLSAYMMKKHSWGLRKTMEFLSFRRPDMNLKPAFLQQLSGYERRLMSTAERPFTLDWSEADFSRLECEELLLRNTYLNSQMGPLAEFHPSDVSLPAQPRRLMWCDGDRDDKMKLEKPSGADRVPVVCGVDGQPTPCRSVLKRQAAVAAHAPGSGPGLHWPGAAENPEVQHPPPVLEGHQHGLGAGAAAVGGYAGLSASSAAAAALAAAAAAAAAVPNVALGGGAASAPGGAGMGAYAAPPPSAGGAVAPEVVPAAWGGSETDPAVRMPYKEEDVGRRGSGGIPAAAAAYGADVAAQQSRGQCAYPPRGPATSIRDSLTQQRRDGTPDGRPGSGSGSRPPSRDPSPKTGPSRRNDSPSTKGKPVLRYSSPSTGRSSGSGAYPAVGTGARSSVMSGGYPGYPGLSVGGVRASSAMGSTMSAPGGSSGSGAPRNGMGAFRSGGPVRAKADLLGDSHNSMRRPRPSTAPSGRVSTSRPVSPLGAAQRSGSNSRPASPHTSRPAAATQPPPLNRGSMSGMSYPHAQTTRSLSGHMRRAPSPTPAFNRNPSPGKPRWRA